MTKHRQHRNLKPCIMCGEPTRNWNYVCYDCLGVFHRGKQALAEDLAREKSGEAQDFKIALYPDLRFAISKLEPDRDDLFVQMGLSADVDFKVVFNDIIRTIFHEATHRETLGNRDNAIGCTQYNSERAYFVTMTPGQAEAVTKLVELLRYMYQYGFREGLRNGESFVAKMANGDLTIDEINDHLTRKEIVR